MTALTPSYKRYFVALILVLVVILSIYLLHIVSKSPSNTLPSPSSELGGATTAVTTTNNNGGLLNIIHNAKYNFAHNDDFTANIKATTGEKIENLILLNQVETNLDFKNEVLAKINNTQSRLDIDSSILYLDKDVSIDGTIILNNVKFHGKNTGTIIDYHAQMIYSISGIDLIARNARITAGTFRWPFAEGVIKFSSGVHVTLSNNKH